MHPELRSISMGPGGDYYLVGFSGAGETPDGKTKMFIARVKPNGQLSWKKFYHLEGYHTTEGHNVTFLPDGDMIAKAAVFKNYNSSGSLWFARIRSDGTMIWDFRPDAGFFGANGSLTVLPDGRVRLLGFAYRNRMDFDQSSHAGWIYTFDPMNPGAALVNKTFTSYKNLRFVNAVDLAEGGTLAVGAVRNNGGNGEEEVVLMRFDNTMNILSSKKLELGTLHFVPLKAAWDKDRRQFTVHGFENGDRGKIGSCFCVSVEGRILGGLGQGCQ